MEQDFTPLVEEKIPENRKLALEVNKRCCFTEKNLYLRSKLVDYYNTTMLIILILIINKCYYFLFGVD